MGGSWTRNMEIRGASKGHAELRSVPARHRWGLTDRNGGALVPSPAPRTTRLRRPHELGAPDLAVSRGGAAQGPSGPEGPRRDPGAR